VTEPTPQHNKEGSGQVITMSQEIAKLSAALVKAQAEVDNAVKNSTNPHFRSDYANLEAVLFTVKPILAKHDLSVVQFPGYEDGVCTLSTIVLHSSGQWLQSEAGAPLEKPTAWSVGSCVTYLRRYSLASICQLTQTDDDGAAASEPSNPTPTKPTKKLTEKEEVAKDWNATERLAERLDVLSGILEACQEHGGIDTKTIKLGQDILGNGGPLARCEAAIKHLEREIGR
jgi:hypothetical protein